MKHEWRKKEKQVYIPKVKPEVINIPEYNFLTISGKGNPNNTDWYSFSGMILTFSLVKKTSCPTW